jgi:hypothetical protein
LSPAGAACLGSGIHPTPYTANLSPSCTPQAVMHTRHARRSCSRSGLKAEGRRPCHRTTRLYAYPLSYSPWLPVLAAVVSHHFICYLFYTSFLPLLFKCILSYSVSRFFFIALFSFHSIPLSFCLFLPSRHFYLHLLSILYTFSSIVFKHVIHFLLSSLLRYFSVFLFLFTFVCFYLLGISPFICCLFYIHVFRILAPWPCES